MARKLKGGKKIKKIGGLKAKLALHQLSSKVDAKKKSVAGADEVKGNTKSFKDKKRSSNPAITFVPFEKDEDRLLLIGEGDFSFAKSIVQNGMMEPENVIATSYDTAEELSSKYRDNVDDVLNSLKENKVPIYHGVDGQNILKSFKLSEKTKSVPQELQQINLIMFNFPHTGSGMKDMDRNIRDHQTLMVNFFKSCTEFFRLLTKKQKDVDTYLNSTSVRKQKIIVSLFEGEPYDSWGIKRIAKNFNYKIERSGNFNWQAFPSYHHRRTNGTLKDTTTPAAQRKARIYVFEPYIDKDELKTKAKSKSADSDDEL